jgi:hypothetical protein
MLQAPHARGRSTFTILSHKTLLYRDNQTGSKHQSNLARKDHFFDLTLIYFYPSPVKRILSSSWHCAATTFCWYQAGHFMAFQTHIKQLPNLNQPKTNKSDLAKISLYQGEFPFSKFGRFLRQETQ